MKRSILIILFACIAGLLSAQDIIVKKDGSIIKAVVFEVTETNVLYKSFSNQEGPTYSMKIDNILSITYENGEKETFSNVTQQVSTQDVQSQSNKEVSRTVLQSQIADLESRAKTINVVGEIITIATSLGALATYVIFSGADGSFGDIMIGTAIVLGIDIVGFAITNALAKPSKMEAESLRRTMKEMSTNLTIQPALMPTMIDNNMAVGLNLSLKF